jgi:hypothetical protein
VFGAESVSFVVLEFIHATIWNFSHGGVCCIMIQIHIKGRLTSNEGIMPHSPYQGAKAPHPPPPPVVQIVIITYIYIL